MSAAEYEARFREPGGIERLRQPIPENAAFNDAKPARTPTGLHVVALATLGNCPKRAWVDLGRGTISLGPCIGSIAQVHHGR